MKTFPIVALLFAALELHAQVPAAPAPAPTTYQLAPDFPKYVTAHIEFRDPTEKRWPSFFYGKPATNGVINIARANAAANFTIRCDKRPQQTGDQSRRVLGELFPDANKGEVTLHITGINALNTVQDKAGMHATLTGTLHVAGEQIPVNAPATLRPHAAGRSDEKNESLMIELTFDTKAGDLGLKTFDAAAPIHIRAAVTAYAPRATPKK
jgi:hypothetical protein